MSRVSDKPYWVYVLWSPSGRRFYTGISECVRERLAQHNEGVSRWTARYRPWELVYSRRFPDYTAARKFENELKRQKGGAGFFAATGLSRDSFRARRVAPIIPLCGIVGSNPTSATTFSIFTAAAIDWFPSAFRFVAHDAHHRI
jgi:predicted GIY-YIG superfamily endonuclease